MSFIFTPTRFLQLRHAMLRQLRWINSAFHIKEGISTHVFVFFFHWLLNCWSDSYVGTSLIFLWTLQTWSLQINVQLLYIIFILRIFTSYNFFFNDIPHYHFYSIHWVALEHFIGWNLAKNKVFLSFASPDTLQNGMEL